jgi:hypothetical protein
MSSKIGKGNLTREIAAAIIGESAVGAAEVKSCEPTNRVGYNGKCKGDELCEWSASASGADTAGTECSVVVYYYTTNAQDGVIAEQDGSAIDWVIAGYDVV